MVNVNLNNCGSHDQRGKPIIQWIHIYTRIIWIPLFKTKTIIRVLLRPNKTRSWIFCATWLHFFAIFWRGMNCRKNIITLYKYMYEIILIDEELLTTQVEYPILSNIYVFCKGFDDCSICLKQYLSPRIVVASALTDLWLSYTLFWWN